MLLAPTVNLHRTPYGGRHFECFSEDPLLTARIGVAYVRGVQGGGVGATVKHFVANDTETERMSVDVRVDERALRELYLEPFDAIVREGGAWAVMAAYNGVDGHPMTESPLLREVLQEEWGFDGVTMSDWFAARRTDAAGRGGLDLVMPGPHGPVGRRARRRRARRARGGVRDRRQGAADPAARRARRGARRRRRRRPCASVRDGRGRGASCAAPRPPASCSRATRTACCRSSPTRWSASRSLGPNAAVARTLGGGSATVFPPYTVSPLDGLRAALGDGVQVDHAVGGRRQRPHADRRRRRWIRRADGAEGVEVRFLAADGSVLGAEERPGCAFNWLGGFGVERRARRASRSAPVLRATDTGTYAVGVLGHGALPARGRRRGRCSTASCGCRRAPTSSRG